MKYVSIDLETTGLNPDTCQILELGAVIDDLKTPLSKLPKFRYRVQRLHYRGESYALSMHAELFKELATIDPDEDERVNFYDDVVAGENDIVYFFAHWLRKQDINLQNFVVAGKNFSDFDARFLRRLPKAAGIKWHHRILDPGSMYVKSTDSTVPSIEDCIKRADIDISNIPGKIHSAIHDALVVCALIRKGFRCE